MLRVTERARRVAPPPDHRLPLADGRGLGGGQPRRQAVRLRGRPAGRAGPLRPHRHRRHRRDAAVSRATTALRRRLRGRPIVSASSCRPAARPGGCGARRARSSSTRCAASWSAATCPVDEWIVVADAGDARPRSLAELDGARAATGCGRRAYDRAVQLRREDQPRRRPRHRRAPAAPQRRRRGRSPPTSSTRCSAWPRRPTSASSAAGCSYADGTLQHAGHVYSGEPMHAFLGRGADEPGPHGLLLVDREVSGVTAACALVRADVFDEVGGFSPAFPVNYNDVDFCLKVRRAGYRILYTPHAVAVPLRVAVATQRRDAPTTAAASGTVGPTSWTTTRTTTRTCCRAGTTGRCRTERRRVTTPRVRVVVLNYDGGEMTLRCLDAPAPARLPARPPRGRARRQRLDRRHRRPGAGRVPRGRACASRWPTSASPAAATSASAIRPPASTTTSPCVNNDAVPEPGWLRAAGGRPRGRPGAGRGVVEDPVRRPLLGRPHRRAGHRRARRAPVAAWRSTARRRGSEARFDEGFWGPEAAAPGEPGVAVDAPARPRCGSAGRSPTAPKRMARAAVGRVAPHRRRCRPAARRRHVAVGPEPAVVHARPARRAPRRHQQRRLEPLRRRLRRRPRLPRARRGPVRRAGRRVRLVRRQRAAPARLPAAGRPVRRAVLPVLRGHRPVVAGPPARLALPLRARRRSCATSTPPRAARAPTCSGTSSSATGC